MKLSKMLSAFLAANLVVAGAIIPQNAYSATGPDSRSSEHVRAIYTHLVKHHWVPQTGLFISHLNSGDPKISQQASTYDQAVVGLLALEIGDLKRAEEIFNFLRNAWYDAPRHVGDREGVYGLSNFYNAEFGGEGVEPTMHMGPNAWAALFAARMANKTQNGKAFQWALEVASWIAHSIPHQNGGVAMGPVYGRDGNSWSHVYSTENNISYVALLSELLRSPRLLPKDKTWVQQEKDGVERWLVQTAFDAQAYVMNRGVNAKGIDTIRALDTFTWLIAGLGPDRLAVLGMDPGRLMQNAKSLFEVTVGGRRGVDPTDQQEADFVYSQETMNPQNGPHRPSQDLHRMIWYEGVGQYITALNIMAGYEQTHGSPEKATDYTNRAHQWVEEFDRAALSAYSDKAAYLYATSGRFYRNWAWSSPTDNLGDSSSLVATSYRCFVELGIDPLSGKSVTNSLPLHVLLPVFQKIPHSTPDLLYGSSQSMMAKAWNDANQRHHGLALRQAQATIDLWSSIAQELQMRKQQEIGHLIVDTHQNEARNRIFSYGVLNDVAAAYFMMGKLQDEQADFEDAATSFRQIVLNYSLAQVWDHSHWLFWAPIDVIRTEYVRQHPDHYQDILSDVAKLN